MGDHPVTYYTWPTEQAFDAWHTAVIEALNLPRIGHNAATGQPEPNKQQTTGYTSVVEVAADDWRAPVEDHVATAHPDGLGTPSDPPPSPPDME